MNIIIIDAQGGGLGKTIIENLKKVFPELVLTCIGTNALATSAMLRAGADFASTGENAIKVCCKSADVIICPIGLLLCDAMLGEVTQTMSKAIGKSKAVRILIPSNRCNTFIAGNTFSSLQDIVQDVIEKVKQYMLQEEHNNAKF